MRIVVKLPGGGWIKYEKKPMSAEAREDLFGSLCFLGYMGFMLLVFWILR